MLNKFVQMLNESPSSFNATKTIEADLIKNGYQKLDFKQKVVKNQKYYLTKNDSSIFAFNIPDNLENVGFNIIASHLDCPSFKVKPQPTLINKQYSRINVEGYGGMIMHTWLDRPLSLCGRVIVKEDGLLKSKIVKIDKPLLVIPNVAIHMNREVNNGYKWNVKNDLIPMYALHQDVSFEELISKELGIDSSCLISHDLYLYPCQKAVLWGQENEFISSFHLDNLGCALSTYLGFVNNFCDGVINIYSSFDNEEIGSLSMMGADSGFLAEVLKKIAKDLDFDLLSAFENSYMISADNAHAIHPNHPEFSDQNNVCEINKGIVIKYNANLNYTSDGISSAIFKELLKKEKLNTQSYTNRSDLRGGSTLGKLASKYFHFNMIDIGLSQLAMHSIFETSGTLDVLDLIKASKLFYTSKISNNLEGYEIK